MKSIRFFLFLFLFFTSHSIRAQSAKWDWVQNGPEYPNAKYINLGISDCVIDAAGNSYVCGTYGDSERIDSNGHSTILHTDSIHDQALFVDKYNDKGDLIWRKSVIIPYFWLGENINIAIDKKGHIYVSGDFNEGYPHSGIKMDFGNGIIVTSDNTYDIFLACYDTSGMIQWATSADAAYIYGLSADSEGDCVLTGYLYYNNPVTYTAYVYVFDKSGNFVFSDNYPSDGGSFGLAATWDKNNNLYVTGTFSFDISINASINYANGSFLVKYNSSYKVQWAKYFEENEGFVEALGLGTDKDSNVYLAGNFATTKGKSSFLYADGKQLPISDSLTHIFFGSYSSSGKMRWLNDISKNAGVVNIVVDDKSNICLTGGFSGNINFGNILLTSKGDYSNFIVKYNNNCIPLWGIAGGGTGGESYISTNSSGEIINSGYWGFGNDTAWFGNIMAAKTSTNYISYLAHLSPCNPPSASLSAHGRLIYCMGDTIQTTLSLSSPDTGNIYTWGIGDSVLFSGRDSVFNPTIVGNYSVIINNPSKSGCTGYSNNINIVYYPQSKINFTKSTANCRDTLYADTSAGHIYQWYLNDTAIAGAITNTYLATESAKYNLVTTNIYGCTTISPDEHITISGGVNSIVSHGKTSFCEGDSIKVIFAAKIGTGYTYQWYKDSSKLTGNTAHTYISSDSGIFQVLITSSAGCQKFSTPIKVIVRPTPASPTITQLADTLISSAATGNQWYKGNTPINGATSQKYMALANGNYYVLVTDSDGCSASSKTVNYTTTGINTTSQNLQINIYPNPFTNTVNIDATLNTNSPVNITIYDMTGREIERSGERKSGERDFVYTFDAAQDGGNNNMFIVKITAGNEVVTREIVRIRE